MRVADELLLLRQDHEAWNASHEETAEGLADVTRCRHAEPVFELAALAVRFGSICGSWPAHADIRDGYKQLKVDPGEKSSHFLR